MKKILITGGAGFIGSALIRDLIKASEFYVINLDKLTYAGRLDTLTNVSKSKNYHFVQGDIRNRNFLDQIFGTYNPDIVMHLAAESHVDNSINGPEIFISTNITGTFHLLHASLNYWKSLDKKKQDQFRFHHISTDEVYGDLNDSKSLFTENTPYAPSSPYSASKASSDHLVRAWGRTYNLPILITNSSNNFGPYHFPEKLIPRMILNAISGKPLPIYGDGKQIRDWLYVEDHARALKLVMLQGKIGETYNIGGQNQITNISVVRRICDLLEEFDIKKPSGIFSFDELIQFVTDRPGHDKRYAVDISKIKRELNWQPLETFDSALRKTVAWYVENRKWWNDLI